MKTMMGDNAGLIVTEDDVQNAVSRIKFLDYRHKLTMQALLDWMIKENVWHRIKRNEQDVLQGLFMTSDDAISLAKRWPYVLFMDSTYSTNVYKLPLFQIIGIACNGKTFTLAHAFLAKEDGLHFAWALETLKTILAGAELVTIFTDCDQALINALGNVFRRASHLLCRWHIFQNFMAHVRAKAGNDWVEIESDFRTLTYAETEEIFDERWEEFYDKWHMIPGVTAYVINLLEVREKFVECYTRKHFTLGHSTTARVESEHAVLK
ncbi:PROTEIN FAR1-RELATED SEQUENCE 11-RELATED [Ceraceosorus bombacis]|uniref:PROTEIN FAR1-RELATED SEQUENCE 11-RELATED n=1 Tax=Ceraceosorus bombacis TaxID=401625 RepID=A0A0P1BFB9_9BASI|nr:PROTEIN FAR1-RELATED SEQUENCE 11-RELATED [Ceraceosorus bombacis]